MKKFLCLLLTICILSTSVFGIDLFVDGKKLEPTVAPTNVGGRVLVPLRDIFEAIGATVDWNGATKTVTAKKSDRTVVLKIGDPCAMVSGKKETMDVAAQIISDCTMVPVRFVSEALDADVEWSEVAQCVYVTTKKAAVPSEPQKPSTGTDSVAAPQTGNVYVTKTGKKYHHSSTCNGGTYTASTLAQAKARGLTPCSKCVS